MTDIVESDPACTDCNDTGITIQTERRCACQGPLETQPDGPEAADEIARLRQRVEELEEGMEEAAKAFDGIYHDTFDALVTSTLLRKHAQDGADAIRALLTKDQPND